MSSESTSKDRVAFLAAIGFIAIVALLMAILAFGRALAGDASGSPSPTTAAAPSAPAVVTVHLGEFSVSPEAITVGRDGTLSVMNMGSIEHDVVVEGTDFATPLIAPGGTVDLDLTGLAPGTYRILCTVAGHEAAGMTATLIVTEQPGAGAADPGEGHGTIDWETMAANMKASIEAFPAATEGTGGLLFEPTILPDGTKEFVFVVEEIDWEVEPGRVVKGMAYNGQIPGPTIKVDVGDRVRIVVENRLEEITSWHPHGVRRHSFEADGVGYISQPPIAPGETWSVEFVAEEQSVGMYHGHDMGIHQVPNGLAGAFIVGDLPIPEGWNVVGEEVMFLNDAGNIGFSLNGKSFPATTPYSLQVGESLLVHYMNEGLMAHPMHLHNNRQLVIAKDGFPLESPYFADVINVAPGERYSVLVLAEMPGVWVWHCHIFTHVERSDGTMFGMLTALIVEE
ncbi:MAG TPA: multicopper oxidase domain-containing protein [Acidimicrobiia bacterium]|nr:multicopper oxidase domain-containing protein [Acidimicrobiia bacterium]